ncbi:uncharacterized protein BROUX77_003704 [Berkeleyomyces rouxiae]|uniref:uncharacterized protein n=1 Tax=Berkeleyomyces rouxiae TaxID=2035830 RepID=UPI003B804685
MSFHLSAEDIHMDGSVLKARLQNSEGDWVDTEIDLNQHLGNVDGHFEWDGENFSGTAENIHFSIEGGGEVPVLRATLFNCEGQPTDADVNLSERITNDNGHFKFE